MRAYKFLATGRVGPQSGFRWPAPSGDGPGAWLEVQGPLALCRQGAHVLRPVELAYWLHDELWELEADGEIIEGVDCLVARRARLVRPIDGWRTGGNTAFAEACVTHATELCPAPPADVRGFLDDAAQCARGSYVALAAFAAASAVARVGDYRAERRWQSEWIATHLL
jgi:hypothetical protein